MPSSVSLLAVLAPPRFCASCDGITEVQPGSFIFMDASYSRATQRAYQNALSDYATVVSRPTANRIVVDAGTKSLSVDMGFAEILGNLTGPIRQVVTNMALSRPSQAH